MLHDNDNEECHYKHVKRLVTHLETRHGAGAGVGAEAGAAGGLALHTLTNHSSVLRSLDQSQLSIAVCGPITAQYCDVWTNQSSVLPRASPPGLAAA